jgi:hypothetical protein
LVISHKSPRAHDAERRFSLVDRLQPAQRGILRVGQHDPPAALPQADQAVLE